MSSNNNKPPKIQKENYDEYVKQVTPTNKLLPVMVKAFFVGGIICLIGQVLLNLFSGMGFDRNDSSAFTTLVLIASSVILTGFNIYPKIVKFGGAGALVPITGFANSVVAPAIEYKSEGQVFGIGCKVFTIAGPVILYGIFSSWLLGILYMVLEQTGLMFW